MIFCFSTDDGHQRGIPVWKATKRNQSGDESVSHSLTYLTPIRDCINTTQRIRTAFDVRIPPDFLQGSDRSNVSLSWGPCSAIRVLWDIVAIDFSVQLDSTTSLAVHSRIITTWESSMHSRKSSFRPSFAAKVNGVKPELFRTSVRAFFDGWRTACLNIP